MRVCVRARARALVMSVLRTAMAMLHGRPFATAVQVKIYLDGREFVSSPATVAPDSGRAVWDTPQKVSSREQCSVLNPWWSGVA